MLTAAEFKILQDHTGSPLNWTQAKVPNATALIPKAIVQATKRENEQIVNSYGLNGTSIQIAVSDVPVPPEKYDRFEDAEGVVYVADLVVPHKIRGSGLIGSYTIYCKGK